MFNFLPQNVLKLVFSSKVFNLLDLKSTKSKDFKSVLFDILKSNKKKISKREFDELQNLLLKLDSADLKDKDFKDLKNIILKDALYLDFILKKHNLNPVVKLKKEQSKQELTKKSLPPDNIEFLKQNLKFKIRPFRRNNFVHICKKTNKKSKVNIVQKSRLHNLITKFSNKIYKNRLKNNFIIKLKNNKDVIKDVKLKVEPLTKRNTDTINTPVYKDKTFKQLKLEVNQKSFPIVKDVFVKGQDFNSFKVLKPMNLNSVKSLEFLKVITTFKSLNKVHLVKLQLHPPNLGQLEVKLQLMPDNTLKTTFIANNDNSLTLLNKALPDLKNNLTTLGFSKVSINFYNANSNLADSNLNYRRNFFNFKTKTNYALNTDSIEDLQTLEEFANTNKGSLIYRFYRINQLV